MINQRLSIIIPCYNCEQTIKDAVESCFKQGLEDFEIVMVNDGSTDNTSHELKELSKFYSNIRIINHEVNMGGGATRNTAVKRSSNEIIFCLDSDDLLPDNTLSKMISLMLEKQCDGVGVHKSIKFNSTNIEDIVRIDEFGYLNEKIPIESLVEQPGGPYCPLYSVFMFTKRSFEVAGGYPEDHGFDTQGFAWRFLLNGLTAYTCPDTEYLHRINFHQSYYIREYLSGQVNTNWIKIFTEFIPLLKKEVVDEIINFDINSDKEILEVMKCYQNIFKEDEKSSQNKSILEFEEFYGQLYKNARDDSTESITGIIKNTTYKIPNYIKVDNTKIYFKTPKKITLVRRIIRKIKKILKKSNIIYKAYSIIISFKTNILNLFTQQKKYRSYYKQIEDIMENKEIILNVRYGGLGDILTFSTLPRLLKEKYDIKFFISEESMGVIRNNEIFKLCLEQNPYFCGIKSTQTPFEIEIFSREKNLTNFISDTHGPNLINIIEKHFKLPLSKKPEIFYQPKLLPEYKNVILIDKNYISGKKLGWNYNENKFETESDKYSNEQTIIKYTDPSTQDIFVFADMIFSCKRYITTLSGGAALAACFDKEFSVILPENIIGGSVDNFTFKQSSAVYIK